MSIDETEHGYFDDVEPGDTETPDDAAPIADLNEANWHLRKIAKARREYDELGAVYAAEMSRVTAELDRLRLRWQIRADRIGHRIAWHEAPLKSYMAMRMREDPRLRTLDLPHGTIKARVGKVAGINVDDKDAVIAWAGDSLPDLVEQRPHLVKSVLDAYVRSSGEIPPGVTVVPPTTTFTITAEGGTE